MSSESQPPFLSSRPSFEEVYMSMATLFSKRSTCKRLHVGCVITSDDFCHVYGLGYNGNAHGLPNTCDSEEVGACGCIHGEMNAVIKCFVPRPTPKFVFCTHSPCVVCAKCLIQLGGVQRLYYNVDYRKPDGLELLHKSGIRVVHSLPAHYKYWQEEAK